MDNEEYDAIARRILGSRKRLFNAIGMGDPEIVAHCISMTADPNATDKRGNTALTRAVRGMIVESSVVKVLLDAGADPAMTDAEGLTALDHARKRLLKYEGKPRKKHRRSRSLTEHGDIILRPSENKFLDRIREEHPENADRYEAEYLDVRRKVAERVFDTRGNLEQIVEMLDSRLRG